jgi:hypothetical protein
LTLLGIVDEAFSISGRGTVASFDFAPSLDANLKIRAGDKIKEIVHLKPIARRKPIDIGIMLPSNIRPKAAE